MNIKDVGTSEITVLIANNSGERIILAFRILPSMRGGESASETYNLDIYGTLEPGMYRIVVEMLSAEFLVGMGG